MTGNLLRWIKNWLTYRKQRVVINGEHSDWLGVNSGVVQGSVLGPLLFLVYIDDLEEGILSKLSKFADDTKLAGVVDSLEQSQELQRDLNRLVDWAQKWDMQFNVDKCKVIHIWTKNSGVEYTMDGKLLQVVTQDRDLGIIVEDTLKPTAQCLAACRKDNSILDMMRWGLESRSREVWLPVYRSIVRPHLEYCVQVWAPCYKKYIQALDRIQNRATKVISGMWGLSYEDRLRELKLFSLERRRRWGELIQGFKFIKSIKYPGAEHFFQLVGQSKTRGHRFKLQKQRPRLLMRQHFFSHRVVDEWNRLPSKVVETSSVAQTSYAKSL